MTGLLLWNGRHIASSGAISHTLPFVLLSLLLNLCLAGYRHLLTVAFRSLANAVLRHAYYSIYSTSSLDTLENLTPKRINFISFHCKKTI